MTVRTSTVTSVLTIALAAFALAPAAAHADIASSDGSTITISGDDRAETVLLTLQRPGVLGVTTDEAGPGCAVNEVFGRVECPIGAGGIEVRMAGGDDAVTSLDLSDGSLPDGALRVDLGAGNDVFKGAQGREVVQGGAGHDELLGRGGDDVLDGGDGNDTLTGDGGRDELRGGAGDDALDGDLYEQPAADLIDGGPGSDKVTGWTIPSSSTQPVVTVSVDGGADDERPGEGDDVRAVERVVSYAAGAFVMTHAADTVEIRATTDKGSSTIRTLGGDDRVTGLNASESIDGGPGADRLEGGFGDDTIVGGPGRDVVFGDKSGGQCGVFESCSIPIGNDVIDVRDGEIDAVDCGVGEDRVAADPSDVVSASCETIERAAPGAPGAAPAPSTAAPVPGGRTPKGATGTPGRAAVTGADGSRMVITVPGRLAVALRDGLRVRLSGMPSGRLTVRALVKGKVVASAAVRIGPSGSASGRVLFTRSARRSLARRSTVRLTVKARSLQRTIEVRR